MALARPLQGQRFCSAAQPAKTNAMRELQQQQQSRTCRQKNEHHHPHLWFPLGSFLVPPSSFVFSFLLSPFFFVLPPSSMLMTMLMFVLMRLPHLRSPYPSPLVLFQLLPSTRSHSRFSCSYRFSSSTPTSLLSSSRLANLQPKHPPTQPATQPPRTKSGPQVLATGLGHRLRPQVLATGPGHRS